MKCLASRFAAPLALITASFLTAGGCGSDTDEGDEDGHHHDGTQHVSISFAAKVNGATAQCDTDFDNVGSTDATVQLQDFRMYVSNIQLIDGDGHLVAVTLDEGDWQTESTALLDFENDLGFCDESGNSDLNTVITGEVAEGTYTGIQFDLGVPFEENHTDVAAAPSPLNVNAMTWGWQGGRKFLRAEFINENEAPNNKWFFHLGSTGCESASSETSPTAACSKPNLPTIRLSDFDAADDTIVADLGSLIDSIDVNSNTAETPPGCMSFPSDSVDCTAAFPRLGLSYGTGLCTDDCDNQALFSVE